MKARQVPFAAAASSEASWPSRRSHDALSVDEAQAITAARYVGSSSGCSVIGKVSTRVRSLSRTAALAQWRPTTSRAWRTRTRRLVLVGHGCGAGEAARCAGPTKE